MRLGDGEAGVAEAVTEGEERRGGVEQIAAARAWLAVVEKRDLAGIAPDADRQPGAGVDVAEQRLSARGAALLPRIPAFEQRVGFRDDQIGRPSWRERECRYVEIPEEP